MNIAVAVARVDAIQRKLAQSSGATLTERTRAMILETELLTAQRDAMMATVIGLIDGSVDVQAAKLALARVKESVR